MEKCLFVYNPFSGKGKIAKNEKYIVEKLSEKFEVQLVRSEYAGHMGDVIREKGEEFDVVVGAGGDGSLNEIVDAVMSLEKRPRIGYIPAGTVNDVAHSLYIPRKIKKAVENILNGQVFSHDIMKVNNKHGIYVCCSGLFTESSYSTDQAKKKKMGKMAYAFHGIKKVFSTPAVDLKLSYEGGEVEGRYAIMLIINSRYVSGMRMNKNAILNDGIVDILLVESKKEIVNLNAVRRVLMLFACGVKDKKKKGIHKFSLDKFKIETKDSTVINLDGERIGAGSFDCQVIKEGVQIIVPKKEKLERIVKKI